MPHGPESCSFLKQGGLLREDVLSETLQVVTLIKEISTRLSLDKFAVEVNWVLDRLVLDRKDFDSLDDLVKEELSEDVVCNSTRAFLPREAEIDPVLHHEEALLPL